MLSTKELLYTLALQRVPNLGDTTIKKLLHLVGSAEGVFKEKKAHLLKIDGIGQIRLKGLDESLQLPEAERELQFLESNAIDYYYFQDRTYPDLLKQCIDGPVLFFSRGHIDLKARKIISIVGTRNITPQGMLFCEKLVESLSPLDPVIVSGFAYGVDITAQKAAVWNGLQTIGCLAHGLDQVYPKPHRKYMKDIEKHGGFITEFWSDDPFERNNFLKRNRIIAGLSEATVVIESAEKGGSLVTADIANSYNREVFAVPGRPSDNQSKGCNNLIKTQGAHILTSAADLIYQLGWELNEKPTKQRQTRLFEDFSKDEHTLWKYLKSRDKQLLDIIAFDCSIPVFKAASLLLELELKGAVRPLPGKWFEAVV
ncbi:MAG: DNA-processing protein DprA [Bacteroidota bacterium]